MDCNCLKAKKPLQGDGLLFTTKSPGDPATQFIENLGATQWF